MMVSATLIIAAMSDDRPGRCYSVDELASVLRVSNKTELHEQLRMMTGDPDLHSSFKLLRESSDDFYRRVSFAAPLALCAPGVSNVN
jgi:hypothetical protein